eukprot:6587905-Prymnesium_polylepis.1
MHAGGGNGAERAHLLELRVERQQTLEDEPVEQCLLAAHEAGLCIRDEAGEEIRHGVVVATRGGVHRALHVERERGREILEYVINLCRLDTLALARLLNRHL